MCSSDLTRLARQINVDLRALNGTFAYDWSTRTTYTGSGAYGEINNSRALGEFDATIIEVAFHDNTQDAALLRDLEAAIARVQAGPKPLALYLFGQRSQDRERLRLTTSSGSLAFNDVVVQVGVPQLAFGGVGESGMGAYHGHTGFLTFSHRRSILHQRFFPDLAFRYPPYAGKLPLVKRLFA